jgi:hypothetical protein
MFSETPLLTDDEHSLFVQIIEDVRRTL